MDPGSAESLGAKLALLAVTGRILGVVGVLASARDEPFVPTDYGDEAGKGRAFFADPGVTGP